MKLLAWIIIMALCGYIAGYFHGMLTDNGIKRKMYEGNKDGNGIKAVREQR